MNNLSIGFNTIITEQWLDLAKVLIDSLLKFSKFPITINCINFKHDFNNDQIISKYIQLDSFDWNHVCMTKWTSMSELPYDITLMIDADMIALPDVDNIFLENYNKIQLSKFPLFSKHPDNPFENPNYKQHLSYLIKLFTNNIPQIKYVYAHGLFFKQHAFFINDMISNIEKYLSTGASFCGDEGLLNVLLTKYQVTDDIGYHYLPYYELYNYYNKNNIDTIINNCRTKFYFLHGCKNPNIARNIFNTLTIE